MLLGGITDITSDEVKHKMLQVFSGNARGISDRAAVEMYGVIMDAYKHFIDYIEANKSSKPTSIVYKNIFTLHNEYRNSIRDDIASTLQSDLYYHPQFTEINKGFKELDMQMNVSVKNVIIERSIHGNAKADIEITLQVPITLYDRIF